MVFNLKWPRSKKQTASAETIIDEGMFAPIARKKRSRVSFLSRYTVTRQLQILGVLLVFVLLALSSVVYWHNQQALYNTAYVATTRDMGMYSQRLAKAAALTIQGDPAASLQMDESSSRINHYFAALTNGGRLFDQDVPPSSEKIQPQLRALAALWKKTNDDVLRLSELKDKLITMNLRSIDYLEGDAGIKGKMAEIAALKLQSNASAHEVAVADQLVILAERIAKNAIALRTSDGKDDKTDAELAKQIDKDTLVSKDLLGGLIQGSEALRLPATTDAVIKEKLNELVAVLKEGEIPLKDFFAGIPVWKDAKQAANAIFANNEAFLQATVALASLYHNDVADQAVFLTTTSSLIALVLLFLILMVKVYLDDVRRRAEQAELSHKASENDNRRNQDAILRLMNELGDLADGDLTASATVTEDITGAIADSINYTVEELRVLVGRINDAAGRVTQATETAQQTSAELLDAAQKQSLEIQEAGRSILSMAGSMTQVSGEADQSAQVARQSLAAAGKGSLAVQDQIKGMHEIREQIQETSKRIKRLGESSQEIGEIVELISDITEQTNVLALNAAIQAASAGDAGRGFTVVAEEVQRLAERSGEATKQIAAIVRTIQADTQGAVSAMEESTHGVVQGAALSDAAGQALTEIGEVSRNLAQLIERISEATRLQANSATRVTRKMQEILRVTEQTTVGTQKTAVVMSELTGLASELKGSVAGFKVN